MGFSPDKNIHTAKLPQLTITTHTHTHIHTITFKDMNTSSQGSLLVDMLCQTTFSLLAF